MIRRPPRSTLDRSSAASDVYKRQIPGGGGEILVDRVRERISPLKAMSSDWLEVMDVAHRLGLNSSATMMFGHVETVEDRIEHLERVRAQQDKSKGFTAFIAW